MRVSIIAAFAVAAPLALAHAAGPFDGQYKGGSPAVGRKCPATEAQGTVKDGKLEGKYQFNKYSFGFGGTVAPDGTVTGKWGADALTGRFAGGHFTGTYMSKECGADRPVTLDKTG